MIKVRVRNPEVNIAPLETVEAPTPTIENVRTVYSGKPGCMCGCLGTHKCNPKFVEEASANRGYEYDEEDISQRSVKTIINKLLKTGAQTDVGKAKQYLFAETATRTYVVYFADHVSNDKCLACGK